jgi:large subunit ribosomal protein L30
MAGTLRVTYKKSAIGYSRRQKETIRSLGFKRLGQTVEVPDNPAIRGMVLHVRHLVTVEEAAGAPATGGGGQ